MTERRRRTPQQKKADEYDRDHHQPNSHGFWRNWSKEKGRAHRTVRHRGTELERAAARAARDPEALEEAERRAVHKSARLGKGGTPSVRERVRSQREARLWATGWRQFFGKPYDPVRHRERGRRFLESLMQGRGGESVRLAAYFRSALAAPRTGRGSHGVRGTTARWLYAFFADEPAVAARFKRWIARTAEPETDR